MPKPRAWNWTVVHTRCLLHKPSTCNIAASNSRRIFGTWPAPELDVWNSHSTYSSFVIATHETPGATWRLWKNKMVNALSKSFAGLEHCDAISCLWNANPNVLWRGIQQHQQTRAGSLKYLSLHVFPACTPMHLKQWLKIVGQPPLCIVVLPFNIEHNLQVVGENLPSTASLVRSACSLFLSSTKLSNVTTHFADVSFSGPSTILVMLQYLSLSEPELVIISVHVQCDECYDNESKMTYHKQ